MASGVYSEEYDIPFGRMRLGSSDEESTTTKIRHVKEELRRKYAIEVPKGGNIEVYRANPYEYTVHYVASTGGYRVFPRKYREELNAALVGLRVRKPRKPSFGKGAPAGFREIDTNDFGKLCLAGFDPRPHGIAETKFVCAVGNKSAETWNGWMQSSTHQKFMAAAAEKGVSLKPFKNMFPAPVRVRMSDGVRVRSFLYYTKAEDDARHWIVYAIAPTLNEEAQEVARKRRDPGHRSRLTYALREVGKMDTEHLYALWRRVFIRMVRTAWTMGKSDYKAPKALEDAWGRKAAMGGFYLKRIPRDDGKKRNASLTWKPFYLLNESRNPYEYVKQPIAREDGTMGSTLAPRLIDLVDDKMPICYFNNEKKIVIGTVGEFKKGDRYTYLEAIEKLNVGGYRVKMLDAAKTAAEERKNMWSAGCPEAAKAIVAMVQSLDNLKNAFLQIHAGDYAIQARDKSVIIPVENGETYNMTGAYRGQIVDL